MRLLLALRSSCLGPRRFRAVLAGLGLLALMGTAAEAHPLAHGSGPLSPAPGAWLLAPAAALLIGWSLWRLERARRAAGPVALGRLAPPRLAGALAALLLWVAPALALHQTHHALEKAPAHCALQAIGHTAGAGCLPAGPAWPAPLLAGPAPLGAQTAPIPCRLPARGARAPPWAA